MNADERRWDRLEYAAIRERMIEALEAAARAREAGELDGIAAVYDEIEGLLPRGSSPEYEKLFVALSFWDGWIDSCNHGWHFHEPIRERDWPVPARSIAEDLRHDREISHPIVLAQFDRRQEQEGPSLWDRIRHIFRGSTSG